MMRFFRTLEFQVRRESSVIPSGKSDLICPNWSLLYSMESLLYISSILRSCGTVSLRSKIIGTPDWWPFLDLGPVSRLTKASGFCSMMRSCPEFIIHLPHPLQDGIQAGQVIGNRMTLRGGILLQPPGGRSGHLYRCGGTDSAGCPDLSHGA